MMFGTVRPNRVLVLDTEIAPGKVLHPVQARIMDLKGIADLASFRAAEFGSYK